MAPHPAAPAQDMRHSFSPQRLFSVNNPPSALHTVGEPYPTSNVASSTPSIFLADSILLMLLLTRCWLGAYISLGPVGWLWHSSIASPNSPEEWGTNWCAGAGEVLSAWNAAVCKGVGICGNVSGNNRGVGENDKKVVGGERPGVPDFVMDYGELSPPALEKL